MESIDDVTSYGLLRRQPIDLSGQRGMNGIVYPSRAVGDLVGEHLGQLPCQRRRQVMIGQRQIVSDQRADHAVRGFVQIDDHGVWVVSRSRLVEPEVVGAVRKSSESRVSLNQPDTLRRPQPGLMRLEQRHGDASDRGPIRDLSQQGDIMLTLLAVDAQPGSRDRLTKQQIGAIGGIQRRPLRGWDSGPEVRRWGSGRRCPRDDSLAHSDASGRHAAALADVQGGVAIDEVRQKAADDHAERCPKRSRDSSANQPDADRSADDGHRRLKDVLRRS